MTEVILSHRWTIFAPLYQLYVHSDDDYTQTRRPSRKNLPCSRLEIGAVAFIERGRCQPVILQWMLKRSDCNIRRCTIVLTEPQACTTDFYYYRSYDRREWPETSNRDTTRKTRTMIFRASTFSCRVQNRPFREALVWLILLCSASVSLVLAQGNETTTNMAPTLAPTPFVEPESGCYADLNQVAARIEAKNAFQVETYTLCPNTVYKIGYPGSNGLTEDGFPALSLRQNIRYICGADGKSSNNCVITGGKYQLISTLSMFNGEVKSNIIIKGVTFQNGQTAGVLLVAPGDVYFEDCIFRVSNFVFFIGSTGVQQLR